MIIWRRKRIPPTHTELCTKTFVASTQKSFMAYVLVYYLNSKDITNVWLCSLWNRRWTELKVICGTTHFIPIGNKVTVDMKHYLGTNIKSKGMFPASKMNIPCCLKRIALWHDCTVYDWLENTHFRNICDNNAITPGWPKKNSFRSHPKALVYTSPSPSSVIRLT